MQMGILQPVVVKNLYETLLELKRVIFNSGKSKNHFYLSKSGTKRNK